MPGHFGALVLVLALAAQPASAATFAATDAAFGSSLVDRVAKRTSTGPRMKRSELREGRLYFSITIVGDSETLARLEEHGHLPLHVTFWGDGERFDTVNIGILPEKWESIGELLAAELVERGVFTFRTHYNTKKIGYRHIELTLSDAGGNTIRTVSGSRNINPIIELE